MKGFNQLVIKKFNLNRNLILSRYYTNLNSTNSINKNSIKPYQIAIPLVLGGICLYTFSLHLFYEGKNKSVNKKDDLFIEKNQLIKEKEKEEEINENFIDIKNIKEQRDFTKIYDELANNYDDSIKLDEFVMGLYFFRRWLIKRHAKGEVVEFSSGTGRNMKYYEPTLFSKETITSLTLLEQSQPMIEVCQQRKETQNLIKLFKKQGLSMKFYLGDAQKAPFKNEQFDTVIDTFGLCSYKDPVLALKEMLRVTKKGGEICLLEHGKSKWNWLNNWLDQFALKHALKWGCWWNRDILKLCEEAGLNLNYVKRWHFGTTYYIIIKKD